MHKLIFHIGLNNTMVILSLPVHSLLLIVLPTILLLNAYAVHKMTHLKDS